MPSPLYERSEKLYVLTRVFLAVAQAVRSTMLFHGIRGTFIAPNVWERQRWFSRLCAWHAMFRAPGVIGLARARVRGFAVGVFERSKPHLNVSA